MPKSVEFYFDFISPAAYLAYFELPKIAERCGAEIRYRPFLLGGVFKSTGNQPPMTVAAKGAWMIQDLQRFARRYQLPFVLNPNFPFNSISLMRGAFWAEEMGQLIPYCDAVYKAVWAEEKNMGDESDIRAVLESVSLDFDAFQEAVTRQAIKDKLRANTDEAVQRGAFGAPTFFVGNEMFWGQDRLDFVEEALMA